MALIIKKKVFSSEYWTIIYLINQILVTFGLRSRPQYWGVVYDSVTKQPLDPVIVTMAHVSFLGSDVETCITDMHGRYGFLAKSGKFKILPRKSNYLFPSKLITGSSDGIYDNVYHGEFFELKGDSQVVAPNIPMDPVQFDWNQQAKLGVVKTSPHARYFFRNSIIFIFWLGFALSLYYAYNNSLFSKGMVCFYLASIIVAFITPHHRLWGEFFYTTESEQRESIHLELLNPLLPGVILGKTLVTAGRFLLRANPGTYMLQVVKVNGKKERSILGSVPVTIGFNRVMNASLILEDS